MSGITISGRISHETRLILEHFNSMRVLRLSCPILLSLVSFLPGFPLFVLSDKKFHACLKLLPDMYVLQRQTDNKLNQLRKRTIEYISGIKTQLHSATFSVMKEKRHIWNRLVWKSFKPVCDLWYLHTTLYHHTRCSFLFPWQCRPNRRIIL